MSFQKVISIHGVPRSGTSWLGEIFNSHPDVAYRFQPLFSYRFKDRIDLNSTEEEISNFLVELYNVRNDEFLLGEWQKSDDPITMDFIKNQPQHFLVMKMVRYHHLIEKLIESFPDIKIIGITRHPCAAINSWLNAPKEFNPDWDPMAEWRFAPAKNQGRIEEFYGFDKWKQLALLFLEFEQKYPAKFFLIQYEHLASRPKEIIEKVFNFCGLQITDQVSNFITESQRHHSKNPYSIFKSPEVKDRWEQELDPYIAKTILDELKDTPLERFLA